MLRYLKKLFRPRKQVIVYNYTKGCRTTPKKKALLYYKTDVFYDRTLANRYVHTNNWEIICIAQCLNQLGFAVDIIDRTVTPQQLETLPYPSYDLFFGIGAGDSGRYFARIAEKVPQALKIFYAAGPDPDISNEWTLNRYKEFFKRHPEVSHISPRRTIEQVKIQESMKVTDVIFSIGNDYTSATYDQYKKPIHRIRPSSSPALSMSIEDIASRNPKHFLYFGGNGNIVKGLDLVVEAFAKLPDCKLFICGPDEDEFEQVYQLRTGKHPNIERFGFVQVGGEAFQKLTADCAFILLPSCSEGIATSVTTCLRRGLIPIVTRETGIDTETFGFLIDDPYDQEALIKQIREAASLSKAELATRMAHAYINSLQYTQGQFEQDMTRALVSSLEAAKRL
ncbi:glycosyltransferase family 4 protein [Patescibacteria group bacterium]|nr:glycosyltransferase family 4 protein [Patescibacteria group bacterium]